MEKNLTDNNLNDNNLTDKKSTDNKLKLDFELVPDGCWYSNLRSILKPAQWDVVRREAYARANGKCMICGRPARSARTVELRREKRRPETRGRYRGVSFVPFGYPHRKNATSRRRGKGNRAFYEGQQVFLRRLRQGSRESERNPSAQKRDSGMERKSRISEKIYLKKIKK